MCLYFALMRNRSAFPPFRPSALVALSALSVLGCSGAGLGANFRQPDLNLEQVVLTGVGLQGGTFDLVVRVENPNPVDLRGVGLRLGFEVEGNKVGDATLDTRYFVPSQGSGTVTVPVRFQWSGVSSAVRTALGYGSLPYRIAGEARFETPAGIAKVPFTRSGNVPLAKAAGVIIPTGASR